LDLIPGLFLFNEERTHQITSVCSQHKFVLYKLNFNDFNIQFVILILHVERLPNKLTLKVHTPKNVRAP